MATANVKEFWERVDELADRIGANQQQIADFLELSIHTYRSWRYNEIYPDLLRAYQLAYFLGVPVEYLITGVTDRIRARVERAISHLKEAEEILSRVGEK